MSSEFTDWADEEFDDCYSIGHDDETIIEDEDGRTWVCRRCGAEGWEDY